MIRYATWVHHYIYIYFFILLWDNWKIGNFSWPYQWKVMEILLMKIYKIWIINENINYYYSSWTYFWIKNISNATRAYRFILLFIYLFCWDALLEMKKNDQVSHLSFPFYFILLWESWKIGNLKEAILAYDEIFIFVIKQPIGKQETNNVSYFFHYNTQQ